MSFEPGSAQTSREHDPPGYLSPIQLAERLCLSKSTIRRRLHDGTIKKIQPGGRNHGIRIPISEVERLEREAPHGGLFSGGNADRTRSEQTHPRGRRPRWMDVALVSQPNQMETQ